MYSRFGRRWALLASLMACPLAAHGQQPAPPDTAKSTAPPSSDVPAAPAPTPTPEAAADDAARAAIEPLRAEQDDLRRSLETMKAALEENEATLAAEREQRAEEVIALQAQLAQAAAAQKTALKLSGFLQTDWTPWRQSSEDQLNPASGDPLNQDRFTIRRARLRATVERAYAGGALELDGNTVNGPALRIVNAEASLKWSPHEDAAAPPAGTPPLVMLTAGLFKIPFGFELLQSDRDRLFLERSTTERALFPGEYDVGARVAIAWRFLRALLAAQNGEPLGTRSFPGRDPNAAKDFAGRLGIETPISDAIRVGAGVSGLSGTGFHRGNPATKPSIQWSDRNENGVIDPGEITGSPGSAATPSRNFHRFGYGADLQLAIDVAGIGATTLYGEITWAQNLDRGILPADPYGALAYDLREFGGYAALTQDVGPYGAVGVRYDYYNPNQDSTDRSKGILVPTDFSYSTIAAVAAAQIQGVRLVVEYDHNRNTLGRDAAGRPTTLKDDAVTVRAQVVY